MESTDRQKELHVISVEEYTDAIENLRYSVAKPDEAKWSQITSLWNTRCHLDILRNCVTDSYFLDSPRQTTSQPHASYPQTSYSAIADDAHDQKQGRIGHSGNAMLVAGAFTISHTKCLKRGL
jgi:hypothetical protein